LLSKFFLYYLLSDDRFFDYSSLTVKGTKMPRGDKAAIMNYLVPNIPLPTQQAIAATLSCLDDKIALNSRINANLEVQAQAIFKSWFADFEPFKNGEFVDSELGRIPTGWREGALKDVATVTMGQSPKGSSYNESGQGMVFYQGRAEFGWRFPMNRLFTTQPKRIAKKAMYL
jgi:type I restriction enzyme S subunit